MKDRIEFLNTIEKELFLCLSSEVKDPVANLTKVLDLYLKIIFFKNGIKVIGLLDTIFNAKYKEISQDNPTTEQIQSLINILQSEANIIAEKDNMFSKAEDLSRTSQDAFTECVNALQEELHLAKSQNNKEKNHE